MACVDASLRDTAFGLVQRLRDAGVESDMDHQGRSLKSQLRFANKLGAVHVVVLGPDELAAGQVTVRDMEAHEERAVTLDDVVEVLKQRAEH